MHNIYTGLNTCVCMLIIVVITAVFFVHTPNGNVNPVDEDFNYAWNYQDGEEALPSELRTDSGKQVMVKRVYADEINGANLCFQTSNLYFDIKLNDELIYTFHPEQRTYLGNYYGDYVHYVTIPFFQGTGTLSIEYEPLIDNNWTAFRDMRVQNARDYEYGILSSNFYKFFISSMTVMFGAILLIFGIVSNIEGVHRVESTSLGAFSIVMGVWTNSGTLVLQSVSNDSSITRLLDYVSLMSLPIPVLIFVAAFTGTVNSRRVKFGLALSIVNFISTIIYVMMGKGDYHDMLKFTHITILISAALVISLIVSGRKNGEKRTGYGYLIVGFSIMIGSGLADMARYYVVHSNDTAMLTRFGLMACVLILAVYELKQMFILSRKSMELEVMERLAHLDGLTGLGNRNALIEFEQELEEMDEGKCVFVQFDINDLKKVNDTYGHAEGDKHITAASDILKKTFGNNARCFRIGGDEFLAIITGVNTKERYRIYMDNFLDMVKEYNETEDPPVKLQVAYGMAEYDLSHDDPEEAEKLADKRMYECKISMKSVRA